VEAHRPVGHETGFFMGAFCSGVRESVPEGNEEK